MTAKKILAHILNKLLILSFFVCLITFCLTIVLAVFGYEEALFFEIICKAMAVSFATFVLLFIPAMVTSDNL